MGLGAGAAVSFGTSFATSRIDFLKASNNWWATPVALAAVGHFLKKKSPALGYAILGIAGAVGVENFTHTPTNAQGFVGAIGDAGSVNWAEAGNLSYNDNQATDASPGTNAAQNAGALMGAGYGAGNIGWNAGALMGAGYGAGEMQDAEVMGLQD
jgi:hypothetical protein